MFSICYWDIPAGLSHLPCVLGRPHVKEQSRVPWGGDGGAQVSSARHPPTPGDMHLARHVLGRAAQSQGSQGICVPTECLSPNVRKPPG